MSRIVCLLLLCWRTADLPAQDALAGRWQGYWLRAGDTLAISLQITREPATDRYAAVFDSERLRVSGIPFTDVQVQGCCEVTMTLQGDRTTMSFSGQLRGDTLSGVLRDDDGEGRFRYTRLPAGTAAVEERQITFRHDSVTLAGSLVLPPVGDAVPAVVFVHGSGAEGRWASRYLATAFANNGIAALIYDKRGVGQSAGDWRAATLDDLTGDAVAAIERLREEPRIDRKRIGIHGHSQGGTLAPMIAARSSDVAFLIASAAAGIPTDSTEIYSILNSVYPRATTAADSADARDYTSELVAVAYHGRARQRLDSLVLRMRGREWFFEPPAAGEPYWSFSRDFGAYHPLEWWRRVRVPVLLIYGENDQRVPAAESAARIAAAILRNTPAAYVTVRLLPGADHTFRLPPGPSGWPVTAPDYMHTLVSWLELRR